MSGKTRQRPADQVHTDFVPIWKFEDGATITIVCARIPVDERPPYADALNDNHVASSALADLDALFEIYGHLRAMNPSTNVNIRAASDVVPGDMTGHLVLLGGVAWNSITAWMQTSLRLPVQQVAAYDDAFVIGGDNERRFTSKLSLGSRGLMGTDVGLFARTKSPHAAGTTVSFCNGVGTSGVVGAVRLFTDPDVGQVNEHVVSGDRAGVVFSVDVVNSHAVSPDLTEAGRLLYQWGDSSRASSHVHE